MDRLAVGRRLRILRIRRVWRLADLAARSGLSCTALHRRETGSISSFARLEVHARALELRLDLRPLGRGWDMVRTLDDEHAAMVNALASALQAGGHRVEVETSYSEWGERGRIELLASVEDALVVGEIKSELADLQELLGAMNAKARLAPSWLGSSGGPGRGWSGCWRWRRRRGTGPSWLVICAVPGLPPTLVPRFSSAPRGRPPSALGASSPCRAATLAGRTSKGPALMLTSRAWEIAAVLSGDVPRGTYLGAPNFQQAEGTAPI